METKTDFEIQLVAAGRALLSNKEQSAAHCNRANLPVEQALMGQHLRDAEAEAIKETVINLIAKFAHLVEEALLENEEVIANPNVIAEGNAVLNAAHNGKETPFEGGILKTDPVEAGLIDTLSTSVEQFVTRIIQILTLIKKSAPEFEYLFDLRISKTPAPNRLMIEDIDQFFTEISKLGAIIEKIRIAIFAHDAKNIGNQKYEGATIHELMTAGRKSEVSPEISFNETRARIQLLQNHFKLLSSTDSPVPVNQELIAYYEKAIGAMQTLVAQTHKLFESEREDPGMIEFDRNNQLVCKSYAERLRTFMEIYRFTILTMNNARRMLLLLECK